MLAGDNWASSKGRSLDAGKLGVSDESAESIIVFFLSKENVTSAGIAVKNSRHKGPCTLDGSERWQ